MSKTRLFLADDTEISEALSKCVKTLAVKNLA